MSGPVPRGRRDLKWQQDAACRGITKFLEDPRNGGWTDEQRIQLCMDECTVRWECLEYALTYPATELKHADLVFGGLTGSQLAKLKKRGVAA
jgi:Transcription factor WhiB